MEILSPASNMEHIMVAIDNHANAVYGGLKNWNARNKTINFTAEQYNMAIKKLHEHNIKFFLTLNILMLDEEINEVIEFLKNNTLPDAFIVADIGLIFELQKNFPDVPLHFSTQFGAHNIDDVNYIKNIGGKRAILSRELTLEEIKKIREHEDIELECFIWGSQCLSFSGLCFFGTLINGGGGNRGKCIITCRDIYSANKKIGNHLYVPDMDCINLISKLEDIDCLKLEGRRRKPSEIKKVLTQIMENRKSNNDVGYIFGTDIKDNNLYEKINSRVKPLMKASQLLDINDDDVCIKYINGIPYSFSKNYDDDSVMYVYTEIKKAYRLNKKNISLDMVIDNNIVCEILYVNYKGDGHTFFGNDSDLIEINVKEFIQCIEKRNKDINIYKLKYQRKNNEKILINKNMYLECINYILNDCYSVKHKFVKKNFDLKKLYLNTNDINVVNEYVDDKFVKIIYDIETISNLKNLVKITNKYADKIIYKLPLFNWNSEDILPYLELLKDKEVMFTRLSQIYLCRNIKFKKKYTDYTVYVWNKKTLEYLKQNDIEEFTASPELSFEINKQIYGENKFQLIVGGKLPLVYTRNCFKHLYGCINCKKNQCNIKKIKNVDKKLDFEILCNDDYRYVLNQNPILNDCSKIDIGDNTTLRYNTLGHSIDDIHKSVELFKMGDYYKNMKKTDLWKNSYECNLLESKQ